MYVPEGTPDQVAALARLHACHAALNLLSDLYLQGDPGDDYSDAARALADEAEEMRAWVRDWAEGRGEQSQAALQVANALDSACSELARTMGA